VSVPVIAFFNPKGREGTTSLVYNLAWMFSDLGVKVLAVDLDPQAGLTTAFGMAGSPSSLAQTINDGLVLLPGDLELAVTEEELAVQWQIALTGNQQALRTLSEPWRTMTMLASVHDAQLVLVDLGPNFSAINRSGLIGADHIVVPLTAHSVSSLKLLGSTLEKWRKGLRQRLDCSPAAALPERKLAPLGYIIQHRGIVKRDYQYYTNRAPDYYRKFLLDELPLSGFSILDDPYNLAVIRAYRSLLPMAQEAHKPLFHLKPADGALGAFLQSAEDARRDFEALAKAIVAKANLPITFDR